MAFWNKKKSVPDKKTSGNPSGFSDEDFEKVDDDHYGIQIRPRPRKFKRLTETAGFPFSNPDEGTEFDDKFFKKLGQASNQDLPIEVLQKSQRLALLLHTKNVRAKRAVELVIDFVLGDGGTLKAKDPEVQKLLRHHLEINGWNKRSDERLRSLALMGEQHYPAFTNTETGLVKISSIDPGRVQKIIRNPDDASDLTAVQFVIREHDGGQQDLKTLKIIKKNDDGRFNDGKTFFYVVNRVDGGTRGKPDILASMDWMEALDGFIFSMIERGAISQEVVYNLTYKGATPKKVKQELDDFMKAIRSGGAYGHNDKVEIEILVPELAATDSETAAKVVTRQIQAGTGLAGLYFGDSEDLTRAAASELSIPVAKMIVRRQAFFRDMLNEMLEYQIQKYKDAGAIKAGQDTTFQLKFPKVMLRDMTSITRALVELGTSLDLAEQKGWITTAQASEIYKTALQQLGIDLAEDGTVSAEAPDVDEDLASVMNASDRFGLTNAPTDNNGSGEEPPGRGVD